MATGESDACQWQVFFRGCKFSSANATWAKAKPQPSESQLQQVVLLAYRQVFPSISRKTFMSGMLSLRELLFRDMLVEQVAGLTL